MRNFRMKCAQCCVLAVLFALLSTPLARGQDKLISLDALSLQLDVARLLQEFDALGEVSEGHDSLSRRLGRGNEISSAEILRDLAEGLGNLQQNGRIPAYIILPSLDRLAQIYTFDDHAAEDEYYKELLADVFVLSKITTLGGWADKEGPVYFRHPLESDSLLRILAASLFCSIPSKSTIEDSLVLSNNQLKEIQRMSFLAREHGSLSRRNIWAQKHIDLLRENSEYRRYFDDLGDDYMLIIGGFAPHHKKTTLFAAHRSSLSPVPSLQLDEEAQVVVTELLKAVKADYVPVGVTITFDAVGATLIDPLVSMSEQWIDLRFYRPAAGGEEEIIFTAQEVARNGASLTLSSVVPREVLAAERLAVRILDDRFKVFDNNTQRLAAGLTLNLYDGHCISEERGLMVNVPLVALQEESRLRSSGLFDHSISFAGVEIPGGDKRYLDTGFHLRAGAAGSGRDLQNIAKALDALGTYVALALRDESHKTLIVARHVEEGRRRKKDRDERSRSLQTYVADFLLRNFSETTTEMNNLTVIAVDRVASATWSPDDVRVFIVQDFKFHHGHSELINPHLCPGFLGWSNK